MHIHKKDDKRIFVFGSNLKGIHGAGAAKYAVEIGAQFGLYSGLSGNTYAIPTCRLPGVPLDYDNIYYYVQNFISFARENPNLTFFISEIGTGFAGFSHETMASMFYEAPSNCDFSDKWKKIIEDHKNKIDEVHRIAIMDAITSSGAQLPPLGNADKGSNVILKNKNDVKKYIMSIPMNVEDASKCRCGSDLNDESNHRCHSNNYGCKNIGIKRITPQYKFTEVKPGTYKYVEIENSLYTTWACDSCWQLFQYLINANAGENYEK